jgi:hypothetical protein
MLDSASLHLANFGWSPKSSNVIRSSANKFAIRSCHCPITSRHLLVKIFQGFSLFSYQCSVLFVVVYQQQLDYYISFVTACQQLFSFFIFICLIIF